MSWEVLAMIPAIAAVMYAAIALGRRGTNVISSHFPHNNPARLHTLLVFPGSTGYVRIADMDGGTRSAVAEVFG